MNKDYMLEDVLKKTADEDLLQKARALQRAGNKISNMYKDKCQK